MRCSFSRPLVPLFLIFLAIWVLGAAAAEDKDWTPAPEPPAQDSADHGDRQSSHVEDVSLQVEAVVINPYRTANIGSQVGGVIDRYYAEEGDMVLEGQVVAELATRRYVLQADRAAERVKALEAALHRAEEDARIKGDIFAEEATTRQEVLKAQAEAEIALRRLAEAQRELDLALFDLDACRVKAPFTGYVAQRFKQPDEPVERLEKIFSIVDTSRVHAVANVPENLLSRFEKGKEAVFVYGPAKEFRGKIDRVAKLIDPKSKTKRVYLVIQNTGNELEAGMSGSIKLLERGSP
jgi:RND family efflux transporter MFP subunit